MTLGRTFTKTELDEMRNEAKDRKEALQAFCENNGYKRMADLNRMLEIYYQQNIPDLLDYQMFIKFTRVDDSKDLKILFDKLVGRTKSQVPGQLGQKKKKLETKLFILYVLNCLQGQSKEDRLKFAFNLFDEEESKVIPFVELKRII